MMNINKALGMTTSERPLQVGDWVEVLIDEPSCADLRVGDLVKVIAIDDEGFETSNTGGRLSSDKGHGWMFVFSDIGQELRRVPAPVERDEVAELREQVRILNEICDDIRDTFGYSRDDMVDLTTYVAQDYAELKEQFAEVTRERDEARREVNELAELLLQEKNKLATVQAEAAELRKYVDAQTNTISTGGRLSWHDGSLDDEFCELNIPIGVIRRFLKGTAGRELLDELKAKDERIKDLEDRYEQMRENYAQEGAEVGRLQNKVHNAKLAYVETLRGTIDPSWFGEQSPVWQYRTTKGVCKVVWRTCDGVRVDVSVIDGNSLGWITASAYSSWQECCDDPKTYPCDESGKRLIDGGAK